jgi:hypothetical protein
VRATDADRDALANALGRHYASGQLDADELDARLDTVLGAQTREEAAGAVHDLPPLAAAPAKRAKWWRRHGEAGQADPAWLPTTERFVDPTTRRVMRVWVDPADHRRHYVAESR